MDKKEKTNVLNIELATNVVCFWWAKNYYNESVCFLYVGNEKQVEAIAMDGQEVEFLQGMASDFWGVENSYFICEN